VEENHKKYDRKRKKADEEIRNIEHKLKAIVQKPQESQSLTTDALQKQQFADESYQTSLEKRKAELSK